MATFADLSNRSIARTHRAIGMVNVALALVCIGTPTIAASAGGATALLLATGLLGGAALMFLVARCFDPRPFGIVARVGNALRQLTVGAPATA